MLYLNDCFQKQNKERPFLNTITLAVGFLFYDVYIAENMRDFLDAASPDKNTFNPNKTSLVALHFVNVSFPFTLSDIKPESREEANIERDWIICNIRDETGEIPMRFFPNEQEDFIKEHGFNGTKHFQRFFSSEKSVRRIIFQPNPPTVIVAELEQNKSPAAHSFFDTAYAAAF